MGAPDTVELSSLVKFSEVFLWDDVMDVSEVGTYMQNKKKYFHSDDEDDDAVVKKGDEVPRVDSKEIKKKYFHSDDEDNDAVLKKGDKVRKVDSMENGGGIVEEVELSEQMNAMGLPLSFNSSKKATCGCESVDLHAYITLRSSFAEYKWITSRSPKVYSFEIFTKLQKLCRVSGRIIHMNISDPKSTNLHADHSTDSYPILTSCSANSKKKTVSNDLGIDPATVLSYPAEPAVSTDANEELDEELNHEYVEASCTTDHFGEVNQYPNGVKDLLVAPNPSSDALEDIELNDDNCYGEFEDWRMYWDNAYQHYYYFNINTTESTWEPPPGMEHLLPGDNDMVISKENFIEVSNVGKNRKARKSRARKTSCGTNEGDVTKYWCQRYYLFSKFDDGIKMDEEGWYSVTPEKIAEHHASRCGTGVILDLFTGVGGNAIQFALRSELVIAVDIDPIKIAYARHNAAIYGVDGWIDFIQGNSFAIARTLKADTVYLSPPWGGPEYARSEIYDLKTMLKPYDGYYLFNTVKHIAPNIVMFLPRNVDVGQLVEMAVTSTPPWSLEVEKNFLNGKLKAVTAYFRATETTHINYTDHECQTD
ncbi:unnamed protein product [Rhodiola kirilowii]